MRDLGPLKSRATPVRVALAVILLLGGLAIVVGSGYVSSDVEVEFGSTWLVNEEDGEIARVTGPAAEVDFRLVDLAEPRDHLQLEVAGQNVYLMNASSGLLQRIDGRALRVAAQQQLAAGDAVELVVSRQDGGRIAVLDGERGRALSLDGESLEVLNRYELSEGDLSGGIDREGSLFATEPSSGEVVEFVDDLEVRRVTVGEAGDQLEVGIDAEGNPSAFNLTAGTWFDLSEDDETGLDDWDDGDARALAGTWTTPSFTLAGRWLAFGEDGSVKASASVEDSDELGRPYLDQERAYVADPEAGSVLVLDAESGEVIHEANLIDDGGFVETTAVDGYGFALRPRSSEAWVLAPDGESTRINLASPDAPQINDEGEDVTPDPGEQEDDEDAVEVGDETESAGGVVVQTTTTDSVPPVTTCDDNGTCEPIELEDCTVGGSAPECTDCPGGGSVTPDLECPGPCDRGGSPAADGMCHPCPGHPFDIVDVDACPPEPTQPTPPCSGDGVVPPDGSCDPCPDDPNILVGNLANCPESPPPPEPCPGDGVVPADGTCDPCPDDPSILVGSLGNCPPPPTDPPPPPTTAPPPPPTTAPPPPPAVSAGPSGGPTSPAGFLALLFGLLAVHLVVRRHNRPITR